MPSEITQLLHAAGAGDRQANDRLIALMYDELHRLARSRMRRSGELTLLDTTSLVHECYLRLHENAHLDFADRPHFLAYAARVMHSIVIDTVRAGLADRRGGDAVHLTLNTAIGESVPDGDCEVLRVHEALAELEQIDARLAQVVEMRYFGGLSEAEIAESLNVTERTVQRDWQKARLMLSASLR
jgi:RNA polymerase sigma factor (TIGR02999 family)